MGIVALAVVPVAGLAGPAQADVGPVTSGTTTGTNTSTTTHTGAGSLGTLGALPTSLTGGLSGLLAANQSLLGGFLHQGWSYEGTPTTLAQVRSSIGASSLTTSRYTGSGVGVALLDTGVVPVPGLRSGNVVNGPDLSFESQAPGLAHLDTFGHGTHMAGIIAGRDASTGYTGVAPGARLTSVKLAAGDGTVDVSQVIAGIDWVVAHRKDDPKNPIRVLNLSYGTDGVQPYQVDPLTAAVENAWRAGIVVVVSAGNEGGALDNPADDPYVLTVGAADGHDTTWPGDDTVPDFSARGSASRRVDLVAPGTSIASLRDPGSSLDTAFPNAVYQGSLFRGSGTSQAAAVVSGAVADLLQARPSLTPDQVKYVLTRSASALPLAASDGRGAGEVNLAAAVTASVPYLKSTYTQAWAPARGSGTLEAARGSAHVYDGDAELTGENDILGPFDSTAWAAASRAQTAWSGGRWMGQTWTGAGATDSSWSGPTWATTSWSGRSWSGRSWSGRSWSGRSWSGRSWSGAAWPGSGG